MGQRDDDEEQNSDKRRQLNDGDLEFGQDLKELFEPGQPLRSCGPSILKPNFRYEMENGIPLKNAGIAHGDLLPSCRDSKFLRTRRRPEKGCGAATSPFALATRASF